MVALITLDCSCSDCNAPWEKELCLSLLYILYLMPCPTHSVNQTMTVRTVMITAIAS